MSALTIFLVNTITKAMAIFKWENIKESENRDLSTTTGIF